MWKLLVDENLSYRMVEQFEDAGHGEQGDLIIAAIREAAEDLATGVSVTLGESSPRSPTDSAWPAIAAEPGSTLSP